MSKCFKEHSAVVVKKEFQLRKAFNFFKTFTKCNTSMNESSIACIAMCSLVMSPYPRDLIMMS